MSAAGCWPWPKSRDPRRRPGYAGAVQCRGGGRRLAPHSADGASYGTVNILVATDAALTEAAQIEALTIAVEARTAAIMDLGLELATGRATGTGTDCIAIACPPGEGLYAGLHTAPGEAVGAAVCEAISRAGQSWMHWLEAKRAERAGRPPAERGLGQECHAGVEISRQGGKAGC